MKRWRRLGLAIASAVALTLVATEVALRLTGRSPLVVNGEQTMFWKPDSLLGWSHEPGQVGTFEKTNLFRTTVKINSQGLRDEEAWSVRGQHEGFLGRPQPAVPPKAQRSSKAKQVLVLGDSFAWGFGVEQTERFSEHLEATLGCEVVNAGVSGYSTDQELLWLKENGLRYEPDLVILVMSGNDPADNQKDRNYMVYTKPFFTLRDGALQLQGVPVRKAGAIYRFTFEISQRSSLVNTILGARRQLRSRMQTVDASVPSFMLTRALLQEMSDFSVANEAEFMIVTTASYWSRQESYADFVEVLRSDGHSVLDSETFIDRERMIFSGDGHWNRAGHQRVGERLSASLHERGWAETQ